MFFFFCVICKIYKRVSLILSSFLCFSKLLGKFYPISANFCLCHKLESKMCTADIFRPAESMEIMDKLTLQTPKQNVGI